MIKPNFLLGCAASVLSLSAVADEAAVAALQQHLNQLHSYSADFEQQVTDAEGNILQQAQGHIVLRQPSQMHWEVLPPNENILIADGQTLWHIDPFVEQVVALDQAAAVDNNPIILLTDPQSPQWERFDVQQTGTQFTIHAQSTDSPITQLSLTFEQAQLTGLAMTDSQGQESALTFSNIQQNVAVADQQFSFTLPQGFELDDQRQH
ncbi:outer membrane lipoprotein chaperone LolA [Aestuariibacter halophilus]|uniref:Outer-membrane lipoprotein carrier protein n=1 Tax=Fluctibacter halophilus TaxID=226011 RepID=A0ABS8G587_9ALTE|nr:outer membrane lipoprotein chaperone LolA [Aestuariibacter halophilus]MCC2615757.1 outer membrane lipoprotein chaperone LolA [Aestuariibacter halophilus]